ncbi:hypothetical protein OROGR_027530 [Orobanche gracilis]
MENNYNTNNNNSNNVISNRQSCEDIASTSGAAGSPYPPGYRFMPTDMEMIIVYLRKKVNNEPIPVVGMSEVNLYKFSPKYLSENYPQLGEKEWYFYTPRDRKYPKGDRPKRSVEGVGYWKATGADKLIRLKNELVGKKKALVFYLGKPKSNEEKTNWIMHEYKLNTPSKSTSNNKMRLDDWVLCRIHEKTGKSNRKRKNVDASVPDNVHEGNNLPSEDNNNVEDVQAFRIENSVDAAIDHNHHHNRHGGGGAAVDHNYNHNNVEDVRSFRMQNSVNVSYGYGDTNLHLFPQQFPASYNYRDEFSNQPLHRIVSGPSHFHDTNGFVYGIQNTIDYEIPYDHHLQQQQHLYFPIEQQAMAWDTGDLYDILANFHDQEYAPNSIFPVEDYLRHDGEGYSTKYSDDEQLARKRRRN